MNWRKSTAERSDQNTFKVLMEELKQRRAEWPNRHYRRRIARTKVRGDRPAASTSVLNRLH
jgi:hypothetical protein